MRADSLYRRNIIDSLKIRFNHVEDSLHQIQSRTVSIPNANLNLYYEISYFVESIFQDELTQKLFLGLLAYEKSIQNSEVYMKAINEINIIVLDIVTNLSGHIGLKEFSSASNTWKNPFYGINGQSLTCEFSDLLGKLREHFEVHNNYKISDETYGVLSEAVDRWSRHLHSKFEQVLLDDLNRFYRILKELEYHINFRNRFLYAQSAQNIYSIYFALNPKLISEDLITLMSIENLKKGEWHVNNQELGLDCKKILNFIELELNNNLSLELVVLRFKAFMELYQLGDQANERECQNEFERFLFLNGYYPVTEARLGSGRLDSLAFDIENAFLYEHKFVKNVKDLIRKLKSSAIQASIYHSRLRGLPRISNIVYIIIFTLKSFEIDGSNSVLINGVTFNVAVVSLDKTSPSSFKTMPRIAVKDVIEAT
ncbi:hypothetical protein LZF95_20855 [Algoriphagus sp. AGSA1]|uniref:hypothetical protein n=1 Tax=Algoriphagus sp. AGSA1 TaxID=2907213 RepID=UPI001F1781F7|nr:hypothetical protein [Algoriphagus sp. AGSA1]MCE7057143.1 hypothetical protein [Algoriphagus sp. AGSA1]